MAENSVQYYINNYSLVPSGAMGFYYDYNESGSWYIPNITGVNGLNGYVVGGPASFINDNLLAYWSFNSTDSSQYIPDYGPSGYTLLTNQNDGFQYIQDTPGVSTLGHFLNAISLSAGTNEGYFITIGSFPLLTSFTISCWVKLDGNYNAYNLIACHWDGTDNNWNFIFIIDNNNHLTLTVGQGGSIDNQVGTTATSVDFSDGQWHYCVAKSDGSTYISVQVDNGQVFTSALSSTLAGGDNSVPFQIGRNIRQGLVAAGISLDDLSIWNSPLSTSQLTTISSTQLLNLISANPAPASFWQSSGSGYYGPCYSYTQTSGSLNLTTGTYAMVYNKTVPNSATLLSTIYTGQDQSNNIYYGGYEFGVTANNYLYFEYYSINGPQVFSSNIPLSDKAAVFLTLDTDKVSFGNYDYFTSQLNSQNIPISTSYLFAPTGVYVGYNPNATGIYCHNKPFTGYIDEVLFSTQPLQSSSLSTLFSGFVNNYVPSTSTNLSGMVTGITGSGTYYSGYYTAITGYSSNPTGLVYDWFGNTYTGYQVTPLTGTVSGSGTVLLTGSFYVTTGQNSTPDIITLNTGFRATFGKTSINLIYPIISGDMIDVNLPSFNYPAVYENNLSLSYNKINQSFYNSYLQNNNFNNYVVFHDGLALNSGLYNNFGGVYNPQTQILNDYFVDTNNEIILGTGFNVDINTLDVIMADTFTGIYNSGMYISNFNLTALAASSGVYVLPWNAYLYNIYYNGQKLLSGNNSNINILTHYGITGNGSSIYFQTGSIFDNNQGQLFALPRNFQIEITGNAQTFYNLPQFYNGYSEVYRNGERLFVEEDYLELATYDINSGQGIFDTHPYLLYNNNDLF